MLKGWRTYKRNVGEWGQIDYINTHRMNWRDDGVNIFTIKWRGYNNGIIPDDCSDCRIQAFCWTNPPPSRLHLPEAYHTFDDWFAKRSPKITDITTNVWGRHPTLKTL